jgi:hypothetical protein
MASSLPNTIKGRLLGDNSEISTAVDLEADTIKLMLLTSSHTPNDDTDVFIDDVSANEVSASGTYSAGGGTLTVTSSTDDTDNEGVFDATDISFTSATITARYAVIYKDTGTPGTSPIVCTIDFVSLTPSIVPVV